MAAPISNLRVRISADRGDIKQGLGLLRTKLAQVKKQAVTVAPDMGRWSPGISQVRSQLVGLVDVFAKGVR